MKQTLIRIEFKMLILCLLWNKYKVNCSCLQWWWILKLVTTDYARLNYKLYEKNQKSMIRPEPFDTQFHYVSLRDDSSATKIPDSYTQQ